MQRAFERYEDVRFGQDQQQIQEAYESYLVKRDEYDMTAGEIRRMKEKLARPNLMEDSRKELEIRLQKAEDRRERAFALLQVADQGDVDNHTKLEKWKLWVDYSYHYDSIMHTVDVLYQKYGLPIGCGRNRMVFRTQDGHVIKLPINDDGFMDNARESTWDDPGIPLASCEIKTIISRGQEIDLLVMEEVTPITKRDEMPDWADYVDCQQVGYSKDGRIVAYDL